MRERDSSNLVRADLHTWVRTTNVFKPGDFDRVIDIAYERLGHGGIVVIVDAFDEVRYGKLPSTAQKYEKLFEKAGNFTYVAERGIYLVRGERVYTENGSVLVLGLNEDERLMNRDGKTSLDYALKKAEDYQGSIVLCNSDSGNKAREYFSKDREKLKKVVAIERSNASNVLGSKITKPNLNANQEAELFYQMMKVHFPHLGGIRTSGGHSINEIGRGWTELLRFRGETSEDMKKYLKESLRPENIGESHATASWIPSFTHNVILYFPFFGWMAWGSQRRTVIKGIAQ